jgi:hypothetical protein
MHRRYHAAIALPRTSTPERLRLARELEAVSRRPGSSPRVSAERTAPSTIRVRLQAAGAPVEMPTKLAGAIELLQDHVDGFSALPMDRQIDIAQNLLRSAERDVAEPLALSAYGGRNLVESALNYLRQHERVTMSKLSLWDQVQRAGKLANTAGVI